MSRLNQPNQINWNITLVFIIISYSYTWAVLFPLSFLFNELSTTQREIWHSLGSLGPAIAGIISLYLLKRREGLKGLKNGLLKYSGIKLLFFAFIPLLILLFTLILESMFGIFNLPIFLQENSLNTPLTIFIYVLPSLCYGFFEEIGWRGFLLPNLQKKFSALKSTIILTVIWWFWHFPAFFYRFDLFFAFVLMFPLMLTGSIVFTYLYNQSQGSLLMLIILHISYDLVSSHDISIIATIAVSVFYVLMDVRAIKVYGTINLSTLERIIL